MRDPWEETELARRFRESSASMEPRAPLYVALAAGIAQDRQLFGLLFHAPETQRLPVLLFASVHALLLAEADGPRAPHELAAWYPNLTDEPRSPDDPALLAAFKDFTDTRAPALLDLLATRTTQTNEVGRCSMMLLAFGRLAAEVGPIAHLDVGCSGGLTLLSDRFQYHFVADDGARATVGPASPVTLTAATRGQLSVPGKLPTITARCGIDISPIDVTDDAEAHWLEACVWPDQTDRFRRLRAAIGIARQQPPELLAGDAVHSLAAAIERIGASGAPVVTNSWVLNYLTPEQRVAYVAELDRIGAERDLSWVFLESPALTPELPWAIDPTEMHITVTTLVRWRSGERTVEHLATSHPHGYWIHAV